MTGNTFGSVSTTLGNNNIDIQAYNSGTVLNVSLGTTTAGSGNTITGSRSSLFQTIANQNTTMDVVVRNNTFTNTQANMVTDGGGVEYPERGGRMVSMTLTFDISWHNSWTKLLDEHVMPTRQRSSFSHDNDSGTASGTRSNANTVAGRKCGANVGDGIFVRASGFRAHSPP